MVESTYVIWATLTTKARDILAVNDVVAYTTWRPCGSL